MVPVLVGPAKAVMDMVIATTNTVRGARIRVICNPLVCRFALAAPASRKYLRFPPRCIEYDTGVKQQQGLDSKPPSRWSRLGRQTAGETFCLTPKFFSQCGALAHPSSNFLHRYTVHARGKCINFRSFLRSTLDATLPPT